MTDATPVQTPALWAAWLALALFCPIVEARDGTQWITCTARGRSDGNVQFELMSPTAIDSEGHTHVALEPLNSGDRYWAPVDLATGRPYGANQPRRIALHPHAPLVATLSPASLLWQRQISSVWPDRKLQEVVPPGRYRLYLEVQGRGDLRARSNKVEVVVAAGGLSIAASAIEEQSACRSAALALFGQPPATIDEKVAPPTKLRSAEPRLPQQPYGTCIVSPWVGEALIDPAGKIRDVWVLKKSTKEACAEFNAPIVEAIRQWEYSPTTVDGRPAPVCMTVTVRIDPR